MPADAAQSGKERKVECNHSAVLATKGWDPCFYRNWVWEYSELVYWPCCSSHWMILSYSKLLCLTSTYFGHGVTQFCTWPCKKVPCNHYMHQMAHLTSGGCLTHQEGSSGPWPAIDFHLKSPKTGQVKEFYSKPLGKKMICCAYWDQLLPLNTYHHITPHVRKFRLIHIPWQGFGHCWPPTSWTNSPGFSTIHTLVSQLTTDMSKERLKRTLPETASISMLSSSKIK